MILVKGDNAMNAQFKKGVLELIVLESVRQKDMYGYQLTAEMKQQSNGLCNYNETTFYPILNRLLNQNMSPRWWM